MPVNIGTIWAEIGLNTTKLDKGLKTASADLAAADKMLQTSAQKWTNNSTKMLMAGGVMTGAVAAVGLASIKMAKDFDASMRNVNSISKLSEEQFKDLSGQVLNLSKKMPQSAKTLADGLYDIASSGFSGADGMKVLEASAKAASAGLTDTATSAKGITAILNAYAKSADEAAGVSDTMFKTVDKGVITFEELSNTVGDFAGIGKIAKLDFNDLSGALAYMTTKGVSAAEAGTSLNRLILGFIDPSKEMAAALQDAGYESGEMALQQLGLVGAMDLVQEASGGSLTELQKLFPEMRALRGASALLSSGIDDLTGYMEDFKDTTGATDRALAEQSKSLEYQISVLKNSMSAIGISVGSDLLPGVTKTVSSFSKWVGENSELATSLTKLGMGLGSTVGSLTLLAGAIPKIMQVIPLIAPAINGITLGIGAFPFVALIGGLINTGLAIKNIINTEKEFDAGLIGSKQRLLELAYPLTNIGGLSDKFAKTMGWTNEFTDKATISWDKFTGALTAANTAKHQGREATIEEKIATAEYENALGTLMVQYNLSREEAEKYYQSQQGAAEQMGEVANQSIQARIALAENETIITGLMEKYSLTREEAEKYAEEQGLLMSAVQKANDPLVKQADAIDEIRSAFNRLMSVLNDGINANNNLEEAQWAVTDAEKSYQEAVKQHGKSSIEAQKAENDLDRANQNLMTSLQEVSTSLYTNSQQKKDATKQALELGLQYIKSGDWGAEAFIKLADQFGISSGEIIDYAEDMGIEIDKATRKRIMDVQTGEAQNNIMALYGRMQLITDKTVSVRVNTYYTDFKYAQTDRLAQGGIVNRYATGGIVSAAIGTVIPQRGKEVPVLAHEGEVILNSSEQANLAQWIMDKSKTVPGYADQPSVVNEFNIESLIVREEADIKKIAEQLMDMQTKSSRGVGRTS